MCRRTIDCPTCYPVLSQLETVSATGPGFTTGGVGFHGCHTCTAYVERKLCASLDVELEIGYRGYTHLPSQNQPKQ